MEKEQASIVLSTIKNINLASLPEIRSEILVFKKDDKTDEQLNVEVFLLSLLSPYKINELPRKINVAVKYWEKKQYYGWKIAKVDFFYYLGIIVKLLLSEEIRINEEGYFLLTEKGFKKVKKRIYDDYNLH